MAENRFDDFYFTIVKETGGLEGLLHSLFSFLIRRTDFFYECDPGDKMGFPPGAATQMLMSTFDMYQKEHYKRFPKKDTVQYADKLKKYQEKQKELKEKENQAKINNVSPLPTNTNVTTAQSQAESTNNTTTITTEKIPVEEKKKEDVPQQTQPIKKVDEKFASISTYNGASTSKYNWSQSISDVTVQVPIPAGTKGKDLDVAFHTTSIKVVLKPGNKTILEGELVEKIKVDDSIWSIDGPSLILTLEKGDERIWKTVIKGDEEIDATKVDNSKPIQDFDPETQVALKKIMYEQNRKLMGLPSSEEEKQTEMLKQAWNSEGSPFKGQPFDPKKFNLPGANTFNIE